MKIGRLYKIITDEMDFIGSFLEEENSDWIFQCDGYTLRVKKGTKVQEV